MVLREGFAVGRALGLNCFVIIYSSAGRFWGNKEFFYFEPNPQTLSACTSMTLQ